MRSDTWNPISLLTVLLFAYARYGFASLHPLKKPERYDLRCRLLLLRQTPSYSIFERFIEPALKGSVEKLNHPIYLWIQDLKR